MSDDHPQFPTLTAAQAKDALSQILADVCKGRVRMQIREDGHTCVLISKDELDALERAIEILANTSEVRKIATEIAAITYVAAQGPLMVVGDERAN